MFQESTKPLLRPAQTQDKRERATNLRELLSAPPHIANRIEDRGQITKNLRALEHDLQTQEPRPYAQEEVDAAVQRANQLQVEMVENGMPTQPEMRRNPPGATDKHRGWDKRNKRKLKEWKNIQLRLHQTGDVELPDATDVANFERFRPSGGSQQLSMDNAQIPGKQYRLPPADAELPTVFSDADIASVKALDPDINLAALNNEQRARVKAYVAQLEESPVVQSKGGWTPERRAKASAAAKARIAAKKAED